MDGTDQFRDASEDAGDAGESGFQGAFGAGGWAGDQTNRDAGFLAQAEDGGDGVFLRAADNQPGDDMGDAHGRVSRSMAFKFAEPQDDVGGLGGVVFRVGQINCVISNGLIGFVFAPGDFAEVVGDRD